MLQQPLFWRSDIMNVSKIELQAFTWNGLIFGRVWVSGCNFRCGYCFVPEIVMSKTGKSGNEAISEIKSNRIMNAIVVTGGEPTLQKDLPIFMKKLKLLGLKTMIETNGSNPDMLEKLIKRRLVDFVRIDVKAPPEKYEAVTGVQNSWGPVKESLDLLSSWGSNWEAVTVWHPMLDKQDLERIAKIIPGKWVVVKFQRGNLIDNSLNTDVELDEEFISKLTGPREIWVRTEEHERRVK